MNPPPSFFLREEGFWLCAVLAPIFPLAWFPLFSRLGVPRNARTVARKLSLVFIAPD
jgi:hypothetical protein